MRLRLTTAPSVQCRVKLAQFLSTSESDFEGRIRELEADPLFHKLIEAGALSVIARPNARFAGRFTGWTVPQTESGIGDLIGDDSQLPELIREIGQDAFQEWFLSGSNSTDAERAAGCGISASAAARLRQFVDRLDMTADLSSSEAQAAPERRYNCIADIQIEGGKPVLAFRHRDTWKGKYAVDDAVAGRFLKALPQADAPKARAFISRLKLYDMRRSTLYRVLEVLMEEQSDYLVSGKREDLRALTQRTAAARIDVRANLLHQLITGRYLLAPWGELALRSLFIHSKRLAMNYLYDLTRSLPHTTDTRLQAEMARRFGFKLSRQSIWVYRHELGL